MGRGGDSGVRIISKHIGGSFCFPNMFGDYGFNPKLQAPHPFRALGLGTQDLGGFGAVRF